MNGKHIFILTAWLTSLALVVVVFSGGFSRFSGEEVKTGARSETTVLTEITVLSSQDMISLINKERQKIGLQKLLQSDQLQASAEDKACDMVERGYFSHLDPDNKESWYLLDKHKYRYAFAGENLIEGFSGDEQSLLALMESTSHRTNILSENFTEIGVGRCGQYTVQHFGTPDVN